MATSLTLAGAEQRGGVPVSCFFRSQSENQAKWQLQVNGFDAKFN
jgi:hypothetical protein